MNLAPTKGHEQSGLRPVLVVSKYNFNKYTNMAVVCPITSNNKKFPTHYELKYVDKVNGSVLCEHVRSIDYCARNLSFVEKIKKEELDEVIDILMGIIEI